MKHLKSNFVILLFLNFNIYAYDSNYDFFYIMSYSYPKVYPKDYTESKILLLYELNKKQNILYKKSLNILNDYLNGKEINQYIDKRWKNMIMFSLENKKKELKNYKRIKIISIDIDKNYVLLKIENNIDIMSEFYFTEDNILLNDIQFINK